MSIQLDWQIEADQKRKRELPDDPNDRRKRYGGVIRLLLLIIVSLALVAGVVFLVSQRLKQVDSRLEQLLRDTVDAEVAALRIGDQKTFMEIQRSATNDWIMAQQATFSTYQAHKMGSDVNLTGRVTDVEIDGQRGRVHVEEIENGVPYLRTWFYWRYDDAVIDDKEIPGGWHHVPPDYTFWGKDSSIERDQFTVRYKAVDELMAQSIANELDTWLKLGCMALGCTALPAITVDILPVTLPDVVWADNADAWQLIVPSPYVDRARADMPFDTAYRIEAATLLAARMVDQALQGRQPVYPADTHYLRSAVIAWLVGRFVQMDTGANLIDSLSKNYGEAKIGQLLQLLPPDSNLSVLLALTGAADLNGLNVDWRDYLTWRLATEDDLIQKRDEGRWLTLVDTRDHNQRNAAYARYNNPQIESKIVTAVTGGVAADGLPQLTATVRIGANNVYREELVTFVLVNNSWLRAG